MVVGNYFTRYKVDLFPTRRQQTMASRLVDKVCLRYSILEHLHSDLGHQFESKLLTEVCKYT